MGKHAVVAACSSGFAERSLPVGETLVVALWGRHEACPYAKVV